MTPFILGATALASLVAALFFLRFWRDTRDRLFCFFAIAFGVDALHRVVLALTPVSQEQEPFVYVGRLVTYGLIIAAIVDKNRPGGSRGPAVRARSFTTRARL